MQEAGSTVHEVKSDLCNWFDIFSYNYSALGKSPHLQRNGIKLSQIAKVRVTSRAGQTSLYIHEDWCADK